MNVALRKPWTVEQFFSWADAQGGRYEFDGVQPVAMTGGTVNHGVIMRNLHRALDAALRGSSCRPLGPDVGVTTVGATTRYPDALVTCAKLAGEARTVEGVVMTFEIVSPGSGGNDRIVKVREYAAVSSIRRYVIVESLTRGVLVLHREDAAGPWTATALTDADVLSLPEVGGEIRVCDLYEDIDLTDGAPAG